MNDSQIIKMLNGYKGERLRRVDFDFLVEKFRPLLRYKPALFPKLAVGGHLFRARLIKERPLEPKLLGPPSPEHLPDGKFQRCSKPKEPLFYAASNVWTAFREARIEPGKRVYLSVWECVEEMEVINPFVTYAKDFMEFAQRNPEMGWLTQDMANAAGKEHDPTIEFFKRQFTMPIGDHEAYKYKLSAAAAHLWIDPEKWSNKSSESSRGFGEANGLLYPSHFDPRQTNSAIIPGAAERHLRLKSVAEFTALTEGGYTMGLTLLAGAYVKGSALQWLEVGELTEDLKESWNTWTGGRIRGLSKPAAPPSPRASHWPWNRT